MNDMTCDYFPIPGGCKNLAIQFTFWYHAGVINPRKYRAYCEEHKIMDFTNWHCIEISKEEYIITEVIFS